MRLIIKYFHRLFFAILLNKESLIILTPNKKFKILFSDKEKTGLLNLTTLYLIRLVENSFSISNYLYKTLK